MASLPIVLGFGYPTMITLALSYLPRRCLTSSWQKSNGITDVTFWQNEIAYQEIICIYRYLNTHSIIQTQK